jgi:outer membrane lipoprotein-sorting protein
MRRLRTASARRLTLIVAAVAALALTAGIAQGALTGSGPTPSPKALANAILDAFKAPQPDGLSATIHFTNNLLPSGSLPNGAVSPLASGADGRLWVQKSGDFRLELQSSGGDAQIVGNGDKVTVYDASSNTVYRATLPADAQDATEPVDHDKTLTLDKVQKALDRLAKTWTISGADPTTTADQPTYTVKISPKDDGGLLGAAQLAWDSVTGAPLRAAIYAQGQSKPVLELKATKVSYDAVPDSDVHISPPSDAKVVDFGPSDVKSAGKEHARAAKRGAKSARVQGVDAVQSKLGFTLAAPAKLAGLPRREVRLVHVDGDKAALTIYGEGFGAIGVLQHKASPSPSANSKRKGKDSGGLGGLSLPEVNIDGATGSELATALGTVVMFERGGVEYIVAGSVAPVAAENAARGLK